MYISDLYEDELEISIKVSEIVILILNFEKKQITESHCHDFQRISPQNSIFFWTKILFMPLFPETLTSCYKLQEMVSLSFDNRALENLTPFVGTVCPF